MIEPTTIRNHPERSLATTAWALARGLPLGARMTKQERLIVAVIGARPTNTITIHSNDATRSEMGRLFRLLVKRVNRTERQTHPLIYIASVARAVDGAGYHVHALLWDYLHVATLIPHADALGLGKPLLRHLPNDGPGDLDYWEQVSYVLTQQEVAFGSDEHKRHEAREKHFYRLLKPQDATLAAHCPQLLSALRRAKSPVITDEMLCADLPRFSNSTSRRTRDTQARGSS